MIRLPSFVRVALLLLPVAGYAAENPANMPMADVDQQLRALDTALTKAAPALPAQKTAGLRAQQTTLIQRVAKVKAGGAVTRAEHDSLLAVIEGQEKQIQAALPKPHPVDSAAVPGGGVATGYGQGYGSTTTIGPNGSVVMSNGPVVNGVPLGDTVVQSAVPQAVVK